MNTEVAIALISAGSSLLVAGGSIIMNNRLLGFKVDELRKDVEKHNNLVERVAILERDNKTAFNKIDENRDDIREVRQIVSGK